jgi:Zn-dependent protease/predicted transcriptional regulator
MRRGSLPLGKVSGIRIFLHWTFILIIGYVVFMNMRRGMEAIDIVWSVLFVLVLFVCVTLHELGHALTAQRYNITIKDIILLPIGGMARFESLPEDPKQELAITAAGPAVNLVIAGLLYLFMYLVTGFPDLTEFTAIDGTNFLYFLMVINLVLAIFNMIPAFPMDGGRVLRALLTFRYSRPTATRIAASVGQMLAILFVVVGFFVNPFLILIGIFVYLGAQAESQFVQSQSFLAGYRVGDVLMQEYYSLETDQTVAEAVKMLLNTQAKDFLVMREGQVVGTLNRNEIIRALTEEGAEVPVSKVMNQDVRVLNPGMPLEELYQRVTNKAQNLMPVMQRDQLLGVLDVENVMEFIMVKEAYQKNQGNP